MVGLLLGALSAGDSIDSCGRRSAYQLSIDICGSRRSLAHAGSVVLRGMGGNFHRALVATAAGEERLIGRRPVRNWTHQLHRQSLIQMVTPYDIKLVFVQKITFVPRKINKKLLPPELHFLTPMCTKWFVGWGFAPDPTAGAYSAPPDCAPQTS